MARRKLPKNVVEMRGNPGKRAINTAEPDPTPIDELKPPRKLKPEATKEWNRVIGFIANNSLVGNEGLSILATYCNIHARIVEMEQIGGAIEAALLTQYRLLASEFGLTPAGRAKLKTGNGKKKDTKEDRFFGAG
jgi:phage terminase small subunit